jgi:hypothetical protein
MLPVEIILEQQSMHASQSRADKISRQVRNNNVKAEDMLGCATAQRLLQQFAPAGSTFYNLQTLRDRDRYALTIHHPNASF